MANRTPQSEWGRLFNFAGGGLVHMEIYEVLLMSLTNPTLFEAIARTLFPYGTHANRPAAGDVPVNSLYFETDTTNLFQSQGGSWVQVASVSGGGAGGTLGGARATRVAAQTIPTATVTTIDWDTEEYDTDDYWAASPSPDLIVIPATGIYLLNVQIYWPTASGTIIGRIESATDGRLAAMIDRLTATTQYTELTLLTQLTATDEIHIDVYQDSGSDQDIQSDADGPTYLTIERLR